MVLKARRLQKHLGRADDLESGVGRRSQRLHHEAELVLGANILGRTANRSGAAPYHRRREGNSDRQPKTAATRTETMDGHFMASSWPGQ